MAESKNTSWSPLFEAYFDGQNVAPGRIKSKDIAEVMTAIEDLIAVMISENHSQIVRKDAVIVGLKSIGSGSLTLAFDVNDKALSSIAMSELRRAFKKDDLLRLPLEARRQLENIVKFLKKYHCSFQARSLTNRKTSYFSLDTETEIPYSPQVSGETVLYGQVTRAGGADTPKIQFKPIDGSKPIYCDTTKKIAVEAAKRLYQEVGLKGLATWDTETSLIEAFQVTEILEYKKADITESFNLIREKFGKTFNYIGDVDEFVASLRED
ncbi:MAG: hypothetical protein AAGA75_27605 [Cyanobacteria bacterium P01_E01_bin.6]